MLRAVEGSSAREVEGHALPTPCQARKSWEASPALVPQVLSTHEPESRGPGSASKKQSSSERKHGGLMDVMGVASCSQSRWLQAGTSHLPSAAESPMRGLAKEHTSFQESPVSRGHGDLGQPTGCPGVSQVLICSAEVSHQKLETSM